MGQGSTGSRLKLLNLFVFDMKKKHSTKVFAYSSIAVAVVSIFIGGLFSVLGVAGVLLGLLGFRNVFGKIGFALGVLTLLRFCIFLLFPISFTGESVKESILGYYSIYGKYPTVSETEIDVELEFDPKLVKHLYESIPDEDTSIISTEEVSNDYFVDNYIVNDGWGNFFKIIVDSNNDGIIRDPFTGDELQEKVLVWSSGRDKISGTADDKKTW